MFSHIMPLIVAAAWDKNLFRLTHTAISSLEVMWSDQWVTGVAVFVVTLGFVFNAPMSLLGRFLKM